MRDIIDLHFDRLREDDELMQNEEMILRLLCGYARKNGKTAISYLKKGGPEERAGLKALAAEVRRKMTGFSGELLALAIDPWTPSKIPGMKPTRRIKFESPARGKSIAWIRDLEIVALVNKTLRVQSAKMKPGAKVKLDAALAAAEKEYGLSRTRIHKIWIASSSGKGLT